MTRLKITILSIFIIASLSSAAGSAPHISGKWVEGEPKDYVHKIPSVTELRLKNMSPAQIQKAIGATGTKNVAVLIVGFPSAGSTTSGTPNISSMSVIQSNLNKMNAFYREVSYNLLNSSFSVITTTFVAQYSMEHYGYPDQADLLIKEIITKAGIAQGSGTGQYDAVMLVHAGYGNESTGHGRDNGDIWSAHYSFTTTNGFSEGLVVSELENGASPLGVMCHEFGHQLGLPDLYATDGRSSPSQVGYWDLMDEGPWAGPSSLPGSVPSHPSVWCKQLLGWVNPKFITDIKEVQLGPIETNTDAVRVPIPTATDPSREYFLYENRSKTAASFDTALPGSGVLIWHIDESVIYGQVTYEGSTDTRMNLNIVNNSYQTDHRGMCVVPADSSDPSDASGSSQNFGDSTDPWPGIKNVFTTPDSDAFNKKPSGIVTSGFSSIASTGKMDLTVTTVAASDNLSISKALSYPNPAGSSYPVSSQKPSGTLTTIVFHCTRPPRKLSLSIYDVVSGMVKHVDGSSLKFRGEQGGPTKDYKWVYEYDWNGKNDSGSDVADGLYYFKVNADDQVKTGKLAVVR